MLLCNRECLNDWVPVSIDRTLSYGDTSTGIPVDQSLGMTQALITNSLH